MTGIEKNYKFVNAKDRKDFRSWLQKNHKQQESVWVVIQKKNSDKESVSIKEIVEECLCFGWVDSKTNSYNGQSYILKISPRNPKSGWSKRNKDIVERMIAEKKMTKAGLEMINVAKANGNWFKLDGVEELKVPKEMSDLFKKFPTAKKNFEDFPHGTKRMILEWINGAKRIETKLDRINETVKLANKNIRAHQYIKN